AASALATLSRGAWLAAAAGVAAAVLLARRSGPRRHAIPWTLAAFLPAAVAALRMHAPLAARVGEGLATGSAATRLSIARSAVRLAIHPPWLGVGPDGFGLAFPRVQEPALWRAEWIGIPVHAHSVPLQVLATLGIAGIVVMLATLVVVARSARR